MTKRLLNIGLISTVLAIILQFIAGFYELSGLNIIYLRLITTGLYAILNIFILLILRIILVKMFKQSHLDNILRAMITISILTTLLLILYFLHLGLFVMITLTILLLINLILYFIFIFRVMEIDKSEIHQIDHLKNYSLAFVICLFGQLILSIIIEIYRIKGWDYFKHFLILIPIIFIGIFFLKIKHEIR